jgi:S-methylmethionine-dependent homocysteine/selenocysteine methylase
MNALPQLQDRLFLTDGAIETDLMFHEGLELPCFAAFDLMKDETGIDALRRYFDRYASLASDNGAGFIFESPTWRASPDWGAKLGYRRRGSTRRTVAVSTSCGRFNADIRLPARRWPSAAASVRVATAMIPAT